MERLVHYAFGLVLAAGGLVALPGDGRANEGFGERVAGTYFVEHPSGSFRVITLNSDGGLSAIASAQGESLIGEGVEFTSRHGSWEQKGAQSLVATVIDFGVGTGILGTAVATYELRFGHDFDTIAGTITLLFFAPGVNPFADDTEPIDDAEITLEGTRVEPGTLQP